VLSMSGADEKKRVLIVDDECVIADSLATIFSNEGYEGRAVYSAEQALQVLSEWIPHLAVIDVRLPEMSGIDLAIHLKEQCRECRSILFAGQAATSDLLASARQSGHYFDILEKPVHPSALLSLASRLLDPTEGSKPP
jgi:DNA-binding NtrC family response regulator